MASAHYHPRIFVGRQYEQSLYQRMLAGDSFWLLLFTGMGGIGKSALLGQLAKITPPDVALIQLDFASNDLRVDPLDMLNALALRLARYCSNEAHANFKQKLNTARQELASLPLPQAQLQLLQGGEGSHTHDMTFNMTGPDPSFIRDKRIELRKIVEDAFYTQVDTLQSTRLILLLDTCEWLQEDEGRLVGDWLLNNLLPTLRDRLQGRAIFCSIVLASRVSLAFERVNYQDIYHYSLHMLDELTVSDYLSRIGLIDPALQKRIYTLTHGHALCISLIASIWQEQGNQPLTLADIPLLEDEFNERALLKFVRERILDRRLLPPYRELTRYGVLLHRFNLPLLRAVFPELLPETNAYAIFDHLRRYPYIEPRGNSTYAFHDLLREILAQEIRVQEPEKWQLYHQRARAYLRDTSPTPIEYYYHALASNEEEASSEWWDAVESARFQRARNQTILLLAVAYDQTLDLRPAFCASRAFQQGLFSSNEYKMEEALGSYEEALKLYRQVGSKLGEANVRRAIGNVQQFRDEREEALGSYEEALKLFRQVGSKLGEANVRKAMGDVQQFHKQMEEALGSYEEALKLFRQVGDRLGEANCYLALGTMALKQEDYQVALELYDRAYALYQYIRDAYSQSRLLGMRSFVHEAMSNPQLAVQDTEVALEIAQKLQLPFVDYLQERLQELHNQ